MTIASVRIYYYPKRQRLEKYLSATHWGFAEWFTRRLKPIREQLRGPEAKGVDIVNFNLGERSWYAPGWRKALNTFEFDFTCDLEPLRDQAPLETIERLMRFTGEIALDAPWSQVRAVGGALLQPLSDVEQESLLPFLTWPREAWFRKALYSGPQLELAMANARRDTAQAMKEARYLRQRRGASR
ncbi:MAG: hypothetical protein ACHP7E_10075 [Burkholderiales bacterium]